MKRDTGQLFQSKSLLFYVLKAKSCQSQIFTIFFKPNKFYYLKILIINFMKAKITLNYLLMSFDLNVSQQSLFRHFINTNLDEIHILRILSLSYPSFGFYRILSDDIYLNVDKNSKLDSCTDVAFILYHNHVISFIYTYNFKDSHCFSEKRYFSISKIFMYFMA